MKGEIFESPMISYQSLLFIATATNDHGKAVISLFSKQLMKWDHSNY